ncbi:MAG: ATP-binding protein [Verrucomicrobiota bacterium]
MNYYATNVNGGVCGWLRRMVALAWLAGGVVSTAAIGGSFPGGETNAASTISNRTEMLAAGIARASGQLPLLTNVAQVKLLERSEALRGYPVRIQGVITCQQPEFRGAVLQDSTLGIYVKWMPGLAYDPPPVGEYCEIVGETDLGFAPMIRLRRIVRLRTAPMPQPVHPMWHQLINGSLDTQYAELQGIVTAIRTNGVMLFMSEGLIKVQLPELDTNSLSRYLDSLVTIQGCLFAVHGNEELVSPQVKIGEISFYNASLHVEAAAPVDFFSVPKKSMEELLYFDMRAGSFQRVKVAGQIIHERSGELFLTDGTNGLRCQPEQEMDLRVGDLVEVAGYLQLGGPSPVLREAKTRKIGRAALPLAAKLSSNLLRENLDSRLVRVEGVLLKTRDDHADEVLEMQSGVLRFDARLAQNQNFSALLLPGSRLELTGVYAAQGGDPNSDRPINGFDLLLNSPADIRVLTRPPLLTVNRVLAVVGVLAGVLAFATIWITALRRQVQRRTVQLQREIHDRKQSENIQALEKERTRIARDLHDDLGSSLTEVSMLAESGRDHPPGAENPRERFDRILSRTRNMVLSLDEIVWAVNPKKDTLTALIRYLAGYAEEYVSASGLACQIETPPVVSDIPLAASVRHQLFLAVKEVLHNAVRHGRANRIYFQINLDDQKLVIIIRDNGRGFDLSSPDEGLGLANLRDRLASLHGRCEIDSSPAAGTTVLMEIPIAS